MTPDVLLNSQIPKSYFINVLRERNESDWRVSFIKELIDCKEDFLISNFDKRELCLLLDFICTY